MSIKEFFSRWVAGTKAYSKSGEGLMLTKLYLLGFIIVGLFLGCLQRLMMKDYLLSGLFFFFGLMQIVDFRTIQNQYNRLIKQNDIIKKMHERKGEMI